MDKLCKDCKLNKPIEEFNIVHKHNNCRRSACKSCYSIRQRKGRIRSGKQEPTRKQRSNQRVIVKQKVYDYLKQNPCIICNEKEVACLQFDHRDSLNKKFHISNAACNGISWDKIVEEIEKCDVLCANCHAKKTAIQFNWYKHLKT